MGPDGKSLFQGFLVAGVIDSVKALLVALSRHEKAMKELKTTTVRRCGGRKTAETAKRLTKRRLLFFEIRNQSSDADSSGSDHSEKRTLRYH